MTAATSSDFRSSDGVHRGMGKAGWADKNQEPDISETFLKAISCGNLGKAVELLNNVTLDIDASNQSGLNGLHLATKEGHLNIVMELLSRQAAVDAPTKKGNTSLHIASLAGHIGIVRVLVQNGAQVNIQSQTGFTPLYMASQENHMEVVKYLLDHGANQNLTTEDGFSPLSVALQQGHSEVVIFLMENDSRNRMRLPALHVAAKKEDMLAATLLVQNGQSVRQTTKSGFTPLHIAAHYGSFCVAKVLIENGAYTDFQAKNGVTPLHVASKWGSASIVSLLIDNGANVECKTKDSLTPLHCAARCGHGSVVTTLLQKGASVTSRTKNCLTALHVAAQGDHVECANVLLYYKAPIDAVTKDHLSSLHVSAHCGNVKMTKLLLKKKCEVNSRALNGFTPLHVACKKNHIKVIEMLLRYSAFVDSKTESGLTPLHVASLMGHSNIVSFLLQSGSDIDAVTARGEMAIHLAAMSKQNVVMQTLLQYGAHVDSRAKEGQSVLHVVSHLGNVEGVRLLLQHGAFIDSQTTDTYTPLHVAVKEGQEEVTKVLLDNGAKQNIKTKKGFTPLHIAAKHGNTRIAKILLEKNAEPNVEGKYGLTPLHVATHYNHIDVATLLLWSHANPVAAAKNGYTPLHISARNNQTEVARILLDNGACPKAESKNGFSSLHLASLQGHKEMVGLLLKFNICANCQSKNGLTPLHLAAQDDQIAVAKLLLKHGSQVDLQTETGYTPLHIACYFGQIDMILFLLENGSSVSAVTQLGYSCLHLAAQQGHISVINILLKYKASPNMITATGHTALSIAHQMGNKSIAGMLKYVTDIKNIATPVFDDKYYAVFPETMQEEIDSDDEAELESHQLLNTSKKEFQDNNIKVKAQCDLFAFETNSVFGTPLSSLWVHDVLHEELKYMHDEVEIDNYGTLKASASKARTLHNDFKQSSIGSSQANDKTFLWKENLQQKSLSPVTVKCLQNLEKCKQSEDSLNRHFKNKVLQSECANDTKLITTPIKEKSFFNFRMAKLCRMQHEVQTASKMDSWISGLDYGKASVISNRNPVSVSISRQPKYSGFLISFLVDARGGAMRGCRHSGVRIIIPPRRTSMPLRVTCRFLKKEKLLVPPFLADGEALAARVLEMGPVGASFDGPVLIEVPHFASLRGKEREIAILRSDDGSSWQEHQMPVTEEAIQEVLNGEFKDLEVAEDLYKRQVNRILTTSFPNFFAIVSRIYCETKTIGPDGGVISYPANKQIQAKIPPSSIKTSIRIGLQVLPVDADFVMKTLGEYMPLSPVVTIVPQRYLFHKPITIYIPLPQKFSVTDVKDIQDLRLLSCRTGRSSLADWDDVTGSSSLMLLNNCISFVTNISGRFWVTKYGNTREPLHMAAELYKAAISVPFLAKFVVFVKRQNRSESNLRVFCVTDDKIEKTLESQQQFVVVAQSRDVEVIEDERQFVEIAGNLIPIVKSSEPLSIRFQPFTENRLQINIKLRNLKAQHSGQVVIFKEPSSARTLSRKTSPICVLDVRLPIQISDELESESEISKILFQRTFSNITSKFSKDELRLTNIADVVQSDWVPLARQLSLSQQEIVTIQKNYRYVSEQALVALHMWIEKKKVNATSDELEQALKQIGRIDVIDKCIMHTTQEGFRNPNSTTAKSLVQEYQGATKRPIVQETQAQTQAKYYS